jgi:hypothetical protein
MSLTKATYSMIQGAAFNVLDFGADPTGVASSVAAFNAAVANGGSVYVPSGIYKLDDKVSLLVDNTALFLAANVTLNVSGVVAQQSPFGSQILIRANNCAIIGSGTSSVIQSVLGTYANTITIMSGFTKLLIRDLLLDGGKSLVTATVFDAFGSGILLIGAPAEATSDTEATIDNVYIRNFAQYGVSIYGQFVNGVKIVNCNIRDIGNVSQTESVGAGIVSLISGNNFIVANNVIKNCKQNGILVGGGDVGGGNHVIANNVILTCGDNGIAYLEQANYGSQSGTGMDKISVTGNVCIENGESGIIFAVDTVGYLKNIAITGNNCTGNTFSGIRLASTNTAPNIVSKVVISGNQAQNNGSFQIVANEFCQEIAGVEMSFTPVISGTTSAGTGTYVARSGTYTLINGIVYFQLVCEWSNHTGTGDILVSGFPYVAQNSQPAPTGWVFTNGLTITGQATFGLTGNTTSGPLGAVNNGAYSAVALDTAALIRINGFYFVDV